MANSQSSILMAKTMHRRGRPLSFTSRDASSLTMCRLKNLLVVTSGMLVPICPTFLLTLQASNDSTDTVASSTSHPTSAPVVSHSRKSWQDYLKENSKSQTMDGNEDEMKRSEQRYKNMEMYFKRWIINHQEERLRNQCSNQNTLCVYWASIGECNRNPIFMEDQCILACQRCDKLIDEVF